MNKKQYEAMRKKLMDEAQGLIDQGEVEKAQEKMKEVEALDSKWDAITQAQANYNALNVEPASANPFGAEGETASFGNYAGENLKAGAENSVMEAWGSEEYKNAWAKNMMNKPMNEAEKTAFSLKRRLVHGRRTVFRQTLRSASERRRGAAARLMF